MTGTSTRSCPICGNHPIIDGRSLCRECEELDMTAYRVTVEVTVIADTAPDPEDFVFEPSLTAGDIGMVMGTPQFEIVAADRPDSRYQSRLSHALYHNVYGRFLCRECEEQDT